MSKRKLATLGAALLGLSLLAIAGSSPLSPTSARHPTATARTASWSAQNLKGNVRLAGEVPLPVERGKARLVGPHPANSVLSVDLGLPLRNMAGLNWLIANEAKTHTYISRTQLYDTYSPPASQVAALRTWLQSKGLQISHAGLDRLSLTATGTTAQVESALHVKINDYIHPATTFEAVKVKPYVFYANASSPTVPARFGIQTASGLSDVDRFYTQVQLDQAAQKAAGHAGGVSPVPVGAPGTCGDDSGASGDGGAQCTLTRSGGGYYPSDVKAMYDVSGHGFDATGETLGFTLWGAGEQQTAQTLYSQDTGEPAITVDAPCVASGNSPGSPSSCVNQTPAANHLINILENGNTNDNFGGNTETALDIEQAHGIATGAGLKYYLADCTTSPPAGSGLSNGNSCNGSDVGMEEAIEDAANDPTLHSVSNSWAFGGEPEWGTADPFYLASEKSLAMAVAAGTTFYFSTGDSGTYQSGYPSDSQYVVGVGGTTLFSTQTLPAGTSGTVNTMTGAAGTVGVPGTGTAALSTEDAWAAGGSWCSNIIARPGWQNIAAVNSAAPCPGRVIPDVSAIADTNSAVLVVASNPLVVPGNPSMNQPFRTAQGGVGGTSVAAPEMNGLEGLTENFLKAQTYPGATPPIGFEAPIIYKLGAQNQSAYYRDVLCGNTASPGGAPDGDAAQPGWDPATGWGAPDWFHSATGYAIALGATGLSMPASTSQNSSWSCAKTPSNSTERGLAFPSTSVGYAVGTASSAPWPSKFLAGGAWGATNTFFKTTDGGATWVPSNSDMLSIACTSASACVEVGDGGVIKTTADAGTTWSVVSSPTDKALTQVTCPSSSVCYAAGDRGIVLKSSDGGQTWSYLSSTDGNPVYGLTCPDVSTCYITDIYAHIVKTANAGNTWTWQTTPVTTPAAEVPGSGGPNPFAALFGVSCVTAANCVAVGGFPPSGTDPPIVATTNGGNTWTLETSNAGSGDYLNGVSCLPGTTTCYAVGRGGAIVGTTDLLTWTKLTSGTTNSLSGIVCQTTTSCVATGQNGTIDVLGGTTWTATTGNGGTGYLSGVACPSATTCYTAGKQGVTLGTTNLTSWSIEAGGGTTQQANSISCPSTSTCFAAANAGTILATTNGGQTWTAETTGTTANLNGIACTSATACTAVGGTATTTVTPRGQPTTVTALATGVILRTTDGSTWSTATDPVPNAQLFGVSCISATTCTAVGGQPDTNTVGAPPVTTLTGNGTIVKTPDGSTWTTQSSGVVTPLSAVVCVSATCYATGGVVAGSGVLLKSTDGLTWSSQTNSSSQALSAITCLDASNCIAGGGGGGVITTTDGATWKQQGNPLSGPTTALNASTSAIIGINGAACSSVRCAFGTGSSGDIMTSPLLTVTVNVTQMFGTTPNLTGIAPTATGISYSIAGEAGNVTGTLTCSTTATNTSIVGTYPISACSGLADNGFSVVYNYAGSSYKIVTAITTTVLTSSVNPANPGQAVTYTATVAPTPTGGTVAFSDGGSAIATCTAVPVVAGVATCTVSYPKSGNHDLKAVYSGNSNSLGSTSETLGETVANCGASPKGCNLQGADFTNADLAGLDLSGANLQKAVFDGANLAGTNLSGSNMQSDSFVGADLTGANLSGANLQKSDFTNAILVGANLQGANMQNSDMTGANLHQALTNGANLNKVTWSNTTCPDGTNSSSHGSSCANNL